MGETLSLSIIIFVVVVRFNPKTEIVLVADAQVPGSMGWARDGVCGDL